jgi:hypothetical protein
MRAVIFLSRQMIKETLICHHYALIIGQLALPATLTLAPIPPDLFADRHQRK